MLKLDDFIPIFPAPIELIQLHSTKDIIFYDFLYSWNRIYSIISNFEKDYYLCKQRCPRCWNSIFRKDRDINTRFYCEKCKRFIAKEGYDKLAEAALDALLEDNNASKN